MVAEAPPEAEAALKGAVERAVITGDAAALLRRFAQRWHRLNDSALTPSRCGHHRLQISQGSLTARRQSVGFGGGADALARHDITMSRAEALAPAGAPTSARLTGSVAVGIIIVEGAYTSPEVSEDERVKVVAEVQNGLGWLASQSPEGVTWVYDIHTVALTTQPGADN